MRLCHNDPLEIFVRKELGAHLLRIPNNAVTPLSLVIRHRSSNKITLFGQLEDLFPDKELKVSSRRMKSASLASEISKTPSKSISLDHALAIGKGFLRNTALSEFDLSSLFKKGVRLQFVFKEVMENYFLPAEIINLTHGKKLKDTSLIAQVEKGDISLYLINSVFVCSDFSLVVENEYTNKVNANVAGELVGTLKNNIELNMGDKFSITCKGEPRTFAFKCFELLFRNSSVFPRLESTGTNLKFAKPNDSASMISMALFSDEPMLYDLG